MNSSSKPRVTGTTHPLPFDRLSPLDFETLTLWLVCREGYENAQHLGEAGSEQGRDILAWKDGRRFAFQCKRVKSFTAAQGKAEIRKLQALDEEERPDEVVFVLPIPLRADTRKAIWKAWGDEKTCHFWAGSELDERVNRHRDIVLRFFQTEAEQRAKSLLHNFPYGPLGHLFTGREEWLGRLRESLAGRSAGQATAIAGQAVHGLGGVGKTRLAVEYANRYATEYRASFFVVAEAPESLRRDLAKLTGAAYLNLPEQSSPEEVLQEAATVRWLREHPGWLLVLDNVDSRDAAKAVNLLLAQLRGGHVLLTGRLARWGAEIHALELGLLAPEDAVAFLLARTEERRRAAPDDTKQAARAAHELGYLPLALEQAAAYIGEQRQTFAGYLQEWETRRETVLAWFDPEVSHYPASVAVTWQTSVDRLSAPARHLLERLAWLGPEPIPESLLEVPVGEEELGEEDGSPREWLAELESYSLVSRSSEAPTFTVHRLVQEVTRRTFGSEAGKPAFREALEWVNEAFDGDPQDVRAWAVLEPLAPHAQTVVEFAAEVGISELTAGLMSHLGQLYMAKALLAQAEPLMRRALAMGEASFGPEHPNVAARLNNLALLLQTTNRLAEAEPLMQRVVGIFEQSLGAEHPNVATALNNLAMLLKATNRPAEAEPLMRRALDIDEASFGPEHPNVGRDLSNLALLLNPVNRLAEAEPLIRRALAINEATFGTKHPSLAIGFSNLALLLKATNRTAEAEPFMRRALAIDEACFGTEHPEVATDLNNLATLLLDTKHLTEAEPLIRRAVAIDEANFGADHPDVARDLNNLAQLLQDTNRVAEAEALMRRVVEILLSFSRATGHEHPHLPTCFGNYLSLLRAVGRSEEEVREAFAHLGVSFESPQEPDESADET